MTCRLVCISFVPATHNCQVLEKIESGNKSRTKNQDAVSRWAVPISIEIITSTKNNGAKGIKQNLCQTLHAMLTGINGTSIKCLEINTICICTPLEMRWEFTSRTGRLIDRYNSHVDISSGKTTFYFLRSKQQKIMKNKPLLLFIGITCSLKPFVLSNLHSIKLANIFPA